MFYITNAILLAVSSVSNYAKKIENIVYRLMWVYMTFVLCTRYGQGTDYFGYYYNYIYGDAHSEFLWKKITEILYKNGINFEIFIAVIGILSMILIDACIRKNSTNKCLALLILYPTIYYVYFFSSIRMGLAIAIFMGILIPLLQKKRYLYYYLICIFLFLLHSASIIFMVIPFFLLLSRDKQVIVVLFSFVIGMTLYFIPAQVFYSLNIGSLRYYIDARGIGILALLEKVFVFMLVLLFYKKEDIFSGIFFFAISFSFMTISWQFISSRFFVLCGCTYIILLSNILNEQRLKGNVVILWGIIVMYSIIILCKNINAYLVQSSLENFTILTCPYINIFNKDKYGDALKILDIYEIITK